MGTSFGRWVVQRPTPPAIQAIATAALLAAGWLDCPAARGDAVTQTVTHAQPGVASVIVCSNYLRVLLRWDSNRNPRVKRATVRDVTDHSGVRSQSADPANRVLHA